MWELTTESISDNQIGMKHTSSTIMVCKMFLSLSFSELQIKVKHPVSIVGEYFGTYRICLSAWYRIPLTHEKYFTNLTVHFWFAFPQNGELIWKVRIGNQPMTCLDMFSYSWPSITDLQLLANISRVGRQSWTFTSGHSFEEMQRETGLSNLWNAPYL